MSGYEEAAFTLEGRNAKNLGFDRCHCIGQMEGGRRGDYAIDTSTRPNHGGAFHWSSGSVIGHGKADFRIGDRNQTIKIDGVYSEKSARMLEMPDYGPGAGAACPVLLENYRFATNDPDLVDKDRLQDGLEHRRPGTADPLRPAAGTRRVHLPRQRGHE